MATWRDKLLDASFRGVPFKVRGHDASGLGRLTAEHFFPGSEAAPYIEDVGADGAAFAFDAFVIGDDYFTARDALLKALRGKGPGELIHPYLGKKLVMPTGDPSMSERFDEGGMATFRLEFSETSEPIYPAAQTDTWTIVRGKTVAAQAAVQESFADRVGGWLKTATNYAQTASGLLGGGLVYGLLDVARQYLPVGSILGAVNSLSQAGMGLVNLIHDPLGFAVGYTGLLGNWSSIAQGLFGSNGGSADDQRLALAGYQALAVGVTPSAGLRQIAAACAMTPDNPVSAVQAAIAGGVAVSIPAAGIRAPALATVTNEDAMLIALAAEVDALGRRLALIEEAQATAALQWASYSEALAARDSIALRLQDEAEIADDAVSAALQALRIAVVEDITARAADLRRLVSYTPKADLPACVIAYAIYGDAGWDDDICARNGIVNPLFVPGGLALEVVSE